MTFYLETPFSGVYYTRETAAPDIRDILLDSDEASDDFVAYYNSDAIDAADMITADDVADLFGTFQEWATYRAYDLLDDATRDSKATAYGITIYADAETEALEERITDTFDPWCGEEARVATFCDLYNCTDMIGYIIECIVNELDPPESIEEAAARVRLIDDIRAYRKARQGKRVQA